MPRRGPDPVNSARARIAYYSRRDVGDPTKLPAAYREFALVKLERAIGECREVTGALTGEEQTRIFTMLLAGASATTAA